MLYRLLCVRGLHATLTAALLVALTTGTWAISQEKDAPAAAKPAANARRLPPHYSKIVTSEQRAQIYAIQKEYAPRLQELRKQLADLTAERDAKARAVLTGDQQRLLDELVAMAKQQRDARRAQETVAE